MAEQNQDARPQFIRCGNVIINLDAIAYAKDLGAGRASVHVRAIRGGDKIAHVMFSIPAPQGSKVLEFLRTYCVFETDFA